MGDAHPEQIQNPLEAVMAASPDCLQVLSADGVVRYVNDRGVSLMRGSSRAELEGRHFAALWPSSLQASVREAIERAVHGEASRVEGYCPDADEQPRWWETHFQRVQSSPSLAVEVIALTRDISDRRARELSSDDKARKAECELSEAHRRTTEFIAALAHELRNPLAPIRSGLQWIRKAGDDVGRIDSVRDMMERQLAQMVRLMNDLLDVARVTSGRLAIDRRRVELREVIQSALEASAPLIERGGHALSVRLPAEPVWLDGDPVRLGQIFTNILNNAAKYSFPGGAISLTATRQDSTIAVDVTDSGIGIEPADLESIFEMFVRVDVDDAKARGGLGLGLNLVRRLVELHGGTVQAQSEGRGKGSHFLVRLPLVAALERTSAGATAGATAAADPRGPQKMRVLLVDDNVDAAATLSMLLELDAHETLVAHSGVEALRVLPTFAPDVIFLDIGMPGMDGYEVAREIRKLPNGADPVLVALTGWGGEADRQRSKNAGFDEHLTKPADIAIIEELLAKHEHHG